MKIARDVAKKIVFPTMMGLGLDGLLRSFTSNNLLNVMYHGVVEKDSTFFSPRHIEKNRFENHLIYLKKNFNIISKYEAFDMIKNNIVPDKKTITLSFDDGYKNNLTTALPLLEKYSIPTTFFISGIIVENIGDKCLWPDVVAAIQHFYKNELIVLRDYNFLNLIEQKSKTHIHDILKNVNYDLRKELIEELVETYKLKEKLELLAGEIWKLMTAADLLELSRSSVVDIGSHGYNHYNLGNITLEKTNFELVKSKELIESIIQKKIDMIAFPDGSYSEEVKDMAFSVGYDYQLAVDYLSEKDTKDKRIMNRHCMSAATTFGSNMIMLSKSFYDKGINI